jgi:hypothetical protein
MAHKGGLGVVHVTELLDVLQQARACGAVLAEALNDAITASQEAKQA